MYIRRFHHVLRNEAGGAGDAGGGGGAAAGGDAGAASAPAAGADGAGAAGASGADGAASGAPAAAGTALSAAGTAASAAAGGAGAAAGAAGAEVAIPEKFVVKNAAGEIDHAATARKVAEGYTGLEKRLGSGDAPPQTVDGYKVNLPEALAGKFDAEALTKDEGFKGFLGKLHAAGASQKVVDAAVSTMLERGLAMREAQPMLSMADCVAELRQQEGWQSDSEYKAQSGLAFTATKQIFGKDFDAVMERYGNDPMFIRGMASIGREFDEDRGPSPEAQAQVQSSVDALMSSPAYLNGNDPKHAETVARVTAMTAQLAGNRPVANGRTHSFKSA